MRHFTIILITIILQMLAHFNTFAQKKGQELIDSLLVSIQTTKEDTNKVNILNQLSEKAGWRIDNYDTALYYANSALHLAEKLSFKKGIAFSYNNIGIVNDYIGNPTEAIKNYIAALKIFEEIGDKSAIANAYSNIGIVHYYQGNYSEALKNYFLALKIKEESGDKNGTTKIYNNIGIIYMELDNYSEALKFYLIVLKIREELGDRKGTGSIYNNIGIVYRNQGNFPEALKNYFAALKIFEETGDMKGTAHSYNNIGGVYHSQGNYPEALKNHFASLKISEESGDKRGIAQCYINIGNAYYNQGNYPEALKNYCVSLKIKEEIGDKSGIASSYVGMGLVYCYQGNYSRVQPVKRDSLFNLSLKSYFAALKIEEEIGNKSGIADSYINIGSVYADQGNFPGVHQNKSDSLFNLALKNYFASLKIKEEIGDIHGVANSYDFIGSLYLKKENVDSAIVYASRAFVLSQKLNIPIDRASNTLIKAYSFKSQLDTAVVYLSLLKNTISKNISVNYFTLSEQEKELYFSTLENNFELIHDFTLLYHKKFSALTDTAYNLALANKGFTLKSSTAMRSAILQSGDTSLIDQYENWLVLKKQIAKNYESGKESITLEETANNIERELVKKSTAFSDFDKVKKLDWKQVQSSLKQGEAAIEFVHFKSELDVTNATIYAAYLIKKESLHPEVIKLCTEKELNEILGTFQSNNLSFVNKAYGTKLLYQKIWWPLEKHLEGIKTIYYSPSGLLHKISFAALSKDNNVFLCDNYQLHQQSSTGKVALPNNVLYNAKDEFLVMGGVQYSSDKTKKEVWSYLPGTQKEASNIGSFLKKKKHTVNFWTANDANEDNFKAQANKANVLHISTHGFFYPDPEQIRAEMAKDVEEINGDIQFRGSEIDSADRNNSLYANWSFVINKNPLMRSGLVLAGANDVWQRNPLEEGEDGILTAQEVSNLDLRNTKLVVLSACETGLGDIKGSEGVYGLQRAFKMAGADYLIMSLWQVPDKETAEFMELFYKTLVKVKDIPKAFNLTQQAMRKKYDPYYWAAFVLIN